jgi:TrmH family RNA methyltransferase
MLGMITSPQNEKVKLARALQSSARQRRKENKIVLEGARLIRDALAAGYIPLYVLVTPTLRDEGLVKALASKNIEALIVSDAVMRHASDTQEPQGVLAVFRQPRLKLSAQMEHILILDAVRDPGNLGTILRTAAAAGIDAVLLAPTCADLYNPKTLRSGMGAHFRIPVMDADWPQIETACADRRVYLADGNGNTRYDCADWSGRWAIIIGSEAHGAGSEARRLAHQLIAIPMAAQTESLNASAAASIILFEARRQQQSR